MKKEVKKEVKDRVNSLERSKIVKILENHGFHCYDTEDVQMLRIAVLINIEDGTISENAIY